MRIYFLATIIKGGEIYGKAEKEPFGKSSQRSKRKGQRRPDNGNGRRRKKDEPKPTI